MCVLEASVSCHIDRELTPGLRLLSCKKGRCSKYAASVCRLLAVQYWLWVCYD